MTCSLLLLLLFAADADAVTVSDAKKDEHGLLIHEVRSPYQAGKTQIRVLLPDQREEGKRFPVIYVLPVEPGTESRFGDGMLEVKKHNLHNKHAAIFVMPTFSHLPWYADHPTKKEIRQETYFLKAVVPYIDGHYPVVAEARGRLLLGFSKSGWGAYSVLLRNPDRFARASAWDAPLTMAKPNNFGMGDIFGSQENFEKYQITRLFEARAEMLQKDRRLILLGYGNFREHHAKAHERMTELKIAHDSTDGPPRKHDWHSGWVAEAATLLLKP